MGRLEANEAKSIAISTGLILANIALMWVFLYTPLSQVNAFVFQFLFAGMIFYGLLLLVGKWVGQQGIVEKDLTKAAIGVILIQVAYAMFGAGILSLLGTARPEVIGIVLAVTAGITLGISLFAALVVYWTDRDFSSYRRYSMYAFLAALGAGFIGSFSDVFALVTFVLVLVGFLLDLIYEIFDMKRSSKSVYLNGLGIYIAFMGVFVHILQLVVRSYLRRN